MRRKPGRVWGDRGVEIGRKLWWKQKKRKKMEMELIWGFHSNPFLLRLRLLRHRREDRQCKEEVLQFLASRSSSLFLQIGSRRENGIVRLNPLEWSSPLVSHLLYSAPISPNNTQKIEIRDLFFHRFPLCHKKVFLCTDDPMVI